MSNIGIILPHLMPSQLAFEVTNIVNENSKKHAYTIFYENLVPNLNKPHCPVMNMSEVKYFRSGLLVCFNIGAASTVLKSINPINPLLYLYDLEWLRGKTDYVGNLEILRKIPLATRSEDYSRLVENYANTQCPYKELKEVLCPSL